MSCSSSWRRQSTQFGRNSFVIMFILVNAAHALHQVLKIALLAERHVTDYTWFVDIILKLIRVAGDYVVDEVCLTRSHKRKQSHTIACRSFIASFKSSLTAKMSKTMLPRLHSKPCWIPSAARPWLWSGDTFWANSAI